MMFLVKVIFWDVPGVLVGVLRLVSVLEGRGIAIEFFVDDGLSLDPTHCSSSLAFHD